MNRNTFFTIVATVIITLLIAEIYMVTKQWKVNRANEKKFYINDLGGYEPEQVRYTY